MASRNIPSMRWPLALAAVIALFACGPNHSLVEEGAAAPDLITVGDSSQVVLAWLMTTKDILSCEPFVYNVRRMHARYGERFRFFAVHVGVASDTAAVRAYFRRQMLSAELRNQSTWAYSRTFGGAMLPSLLVVKGNTVVMVESSLGKPRFPDLIAELLDPSIALLGSSEHHF